MHTPEHHNRRATHTGGRPAPAPEVEHEGRARRLWYGLRLRNAPKTDDEVVDEDVDTDGGCPLHRSPDHQHSLEQQNNTHLTTTTEDSL
jgi:hypothetical protein